LTAWLFDSAMPPAGEMTTDGTTRRGIDAQLSLVRVEITNASLHARGAVAARTLSRKVHVPKNLLEANGPRAARRDFVSSLRSAILKSALEFLNFSNAIFIKEVEVAIPC
jgi:hypothetical protein